MFKISAQSLASAIVTESKFLCSMHSKAKQTKRVGVQTWERFIAGTSKENEVTHAQKKNLPSGLGEKFYRQKKDRLYPLHQMAQIQAYEQNFL